MAAEDDAPRHPEYLVEDQSGESRSAHRKWAHETGRVEGDRARERRRPVGWRLRLSEWRHRATRFTGGARQEQSGTGFLRHLEQRQSLRDSPPDSNRDETRDARQAHPEVRRDVEAEGEDPPVREAQARPISSREWAV